METDLRQALDREQLYLNYQPVFTVATNRQTAYEALARWPHPKFGFVPPSRFIPVAEETRAHHLARRVELLREAQCANARWWQEPWKAWGACPQVVFPPPQFARADFVDTVFGALNDTKLTGNLLDLELTESIVMHDIDGAIQGEMAQVAAVYGVRILQWTISAPAIRRSVIFLSCPSIFSKIDRCFVVADRRELTHAVPLINSMISLAHSIGKASGLWKGSRLNPAVGNLA